MVRAEFTPSKARLLALKVQGPQVSVPQAQLLAPGCFSSSDSGNCNRVRDAAVMKHEFPEVELALSQAVTKIPSFEQDVCKEPSTPPSLNRMCLRQRKSSA